MGVTRRQALTGIAGGALAGVGTASGCAPVPWATFLSAASDREGGHWIAAFDAGGEVFRTALPGRGHEVTVAPKDRAFAFAPARRPGDWAAVLDLADGRLLELRRAEPGRHFFGHALFSPGGLHLLTPENDYRRGQGVVVIRCADSLSVLAEWPSGGVGPHEIAWLDERTLAVANGGIRTHPGQPRRKLNLAEMQPNLALIDVLSGKILHRALPPHHQSSIRHMDVTSDGRIVLALQHEGSLAADTPLVLVFDAASGKLRVLPVPLAVQRRMRQYTASACVDPNTNRALVTAPRGHLVTFWDLRGGLLAHARLRDAGGVALDTAAGEFVVTSGTGHVMRFDSATGETRGTAFRHPGLRWDNHLAAA